MGSVSETIQVTGVRCERCVMRLGGVLRRLDGIEAANANLMGQVTITFDDEIVSREDIVTALAGGGFKPASV
ncbi:MAG: heavy-metal-associated domain-containing protein [Thermoleophilia bacterium]